MEYTNLGDTGVTVSRICLGCMSFGDPGWRKWVQGEAFGHELVERALDLGINFFDTANMYSRGESERILGEALEGYKQESVIATKVFFQMDEEDPNSRGLSRKAVEQKLDASLDRLGVNTIDLYQTHRWDYDTPIDETMAALTDAVRHGKVRYLGGSSMWAHQFATALHTSAELGLERFATMQNHYNLAYREEEREMLPLCEKEGIGVNPWSPLARGFLARPHDEYMSTVRAESDDYAQIHPYAENGGREVNERVQELAADEGVSMAQIALAWLLHKDSVDAPIIGTSSVEHLEDAVEALEIDLSDSDMEYLEEPYGPVRVSGHQ
jgi:aryl-alcohol dehydrogenase-like predicted oxidoreductase